MKTEIMKTRGERIIYKLEVPNIIITKDVNTVRKRLQEAIDAYEASNKMPNSSATISSYAFKEAIENMFKDNEPKTMHITNTSSSVAYKVELYKGDVVRGTCTTYYSIVARFYRFDEI